MTTLNELYRCLNRLKNDKGFRSIRSFSCFYFPMALCLLPGILWATNTHDPHGARYTTHMPFIHYKFADVTPLSYHYLSSGSEKFSGKMDSSVNDTVPGPSSVMRKSMMIPGWGQIVNRQHWKVPIIYGMLAGLTYYSVVTNKNYRDYRAAFYNSQSENGDERFGPTPSHIDPNQNPESLRYSRNVYRNRRDLTVIGVFLAYGLNILDAYVFAHMRDFDVSDDLSAGIYLGPLLSQKPLSTPNNDLTYASGAFQFDGIILTLQIKMH